MRMVRLRIAGLFLAVACWSTVSCALVSTSKAKAKSKENSKPEWNKELRFVIETLGRLKDSGELVEGTDWHDVMPERHAPYGASLGDSADSVSTSMLEKGKTARGKGSKTKEDGLDKPDPAIPSKIAAMLEKLGFKQLSKDFRSSLESKKGPTPSIESMNNTENATQGAKAATQSSKMDEKGTKSPKMDDVQAKLGYESSESGTWGSGTEYSARDSSSSSSSSSSGKSTTSTGHYGQILPENEVPAQRASAPDAAAINEEPSSTQTEGGSSYGSTGDLSLSMSRQAGQESTSTSFGEGAGVQVQQGGGESLISENRTQLITMVHKIAKEEGIRSLAAAPCHTTLQWMPEVVAKLEFELPEFRFYCVDMDESSESVSPRATSAFSAVSSSSIIKVMPMDTEVSFPKNVDLVVSWKGMPGWGVRKSWRFIKGLRRSGTKMALFGNDPTTKQNDEGTSKLNVRKSPMLFNEPLRVISKVGSDENDPAQLLLYTLDSIRDGF